MERAEVIRELDGWLKFVKGKGTTLNPKATRMMSALLRAKEMLIEDEQQILELRAVVLRRG